MARLCTVCNHPNRAEIDTKLLRDDSIAKIAQEFAVSYDALYRHVKASHHVSAAALSPTAAEITKADSILDQIGMYRSEADRFRKVAEANGDIGLALKALDRALKCIDLYARIQGLIKDQSQITINQMNVYQSPEWLVVGNLLADILNDYPELRREVSNGLLALQEAHR